MKARFNQSFKLQAVEKALSRAEYELKILNNPLSQLTAVASSIEISLDAASTSQQFRVYGKDLK